MDRRITAAQEQLLFMSVGHMKEGNSRQPREDSASGPAGGEDVEAG
ncbi:hypothetical protein [Streptomyces sp. NPDC054849]